MKSTYANRGKFLESVIERSNITYKTKGIALIEKVATPINYNTRTNKAFHEKKSTVDFIGCMANGGPFIAFDAKETKGKSFPFANVTDHQIEYMEYTNRMGHVAFLLLYFTDLRECYRLTIDQYVTYKQAADRKSIPHQWIKDNAVLIESGYGLPLDYLKNINGV
ncbi:Holliday junction resolvase RecU [Salinicoccus sesuvii]|uniref:Holliday junction resolvase RecU n=1 Tax=Salinicoccus sesuvii TaxID=868281 RepID=A0ABV7NA49_9STAP